jgi:hypothetical protein
MYRVLQQWRASLTSSSRLEELLCSYSGCVIGRSFFQDERHCAHSLYGVSLGMDWYNVFLMVVVL